MSNRRQKNSQATISYVRKDLTVQENTFMFPTFFILVLPNNWFCSFLICFKWKGRMAVGGQESSGMFVHTAFSLPHIPQPTDTAWLSRWSSIRKGAVPMKHWLQRDPRSYGSKQRNVSRVPGDYQLEWSAVAPCGDDGRPPGSLFGTE